MLYQPNRPRLLATFRVPRRVDHVTWRVTVSGNNDMANASLWLTHPTQLYASPENPGGSGVEGCDGMWQCWVGLVWDGRSDRMGWEVAGFGRGRAGMGMRCEARLEAQEIGPQHSPSTFAPCLCRSSCLCFCRSFVASYCSLPSLLSPLAFSLSPLPSPLSPPPVGVAGAHVIVELLCTRVQGLQWAPRLAKPSLVKRHNAIIQSRNNACMQSCNPAPVPLQRPPAELHLTRQPHPAASPACT